MGILLPPVTQVTTVTNTHLTLHHRNRSLDSALQKIPEVDVTPSPECENVVVVSTILSTSSDVVVVQSQSTKTTQRDELASLGSDDSGILCGSDSGSSDSNATRESSVEYLSTNCNESRESLDTIDKTNLNCDDDETIISECITKKLIVLSMMVVVSLLMMMMMMMIKMMYKKGLLIIIVVVIVNCVKRHQKVPVC